MVEESEKDTDIIKKKIGADFKNQIKSSSHDYLEKLKIEINKGITNYYDELNTKVSDELLSQESQQKQLHDQIEIYGNKNNICMKSIKKIHKIIFILLEKLVTLRRKTMLFRFFKNLRIERKNNKHLKFLISKFHDRNLKRKGLNFIKKFTVLEKSQAYELKLKEKTENDLRNYEESLRNQKENLLSLIYRAEQKLKHENKKKVQTKLELDKIVLKGVSALNMKALLLSQNSLNDVVKTDYNREIEKKYSSMIFPDTKATINAKRSNKQGQIIK